MEGQDAEPGGRPEGWGAGPTLGSLKSSDFFKQVGDCLTPIVSFSKFCFPPLDLTLYVAWWKFHLCMGLNVHAPVGTCAFMHVSVRACRCVCLCLHILRATVQRIGTWELGTESTKITSNKFISISITHWYPSRISSNHFLKLTLYHSTVKRRVTD